MTVNPLHSALSGIQQQRAALDRAAEKIARATLDPQATQGHSGPNESAVAQLDQGLVEALVARRMFTAAVRMAQSTNEGIVEALRHGGYDAS